MVFSHHANIFGISFFFLIFSEDRVKISKEGKKGIGNQPRRKSFDQFEIFHLNDLIL